MAVKSPDKKRYEYTRVEKSRFVTIIRRRPIKKCPIAVAMAEKLAKGV